ncbi:hypothetical protein ABIA27_001097 [Sinorhizobium fredii]
MKNHRLNSNYGVAFALFQQTQNFGLNACTTVTLLRGEVGLLRSLQSEPFQCFGRQA